MFRDSCNSQLVEGEQRLPAPQRIEWCDAYQLGVPRHLLLRPTAGPYVRAVRDWLRTWGTLPSRTHAGAGVVTRQEVRIARSKPNTGA
jgi:hypothetical protein